MLLCIYMQSLLCVCVQSLLLIDQLNHSFRNNSYLYTVFQSGELKLDMEGRRQHVTHIIQLLVESFLYIVTSLRAVTI